MIGYAKCATFKSHRHRRTLFSSVPDTMRLEDIIASPIGTQRDPSLHSSNIPRTNMLSPLHYRDLMPHISELACPAPP